jgi:hypothetical protein
VHACPVDAIFGDYEVPEKFEYAVELNEEFFIQRSIPEHGERTAA